jgi:hypothetical protein
MPPNAGKKKAAVHSDEASGRANAKDKSDSGGSDGKRKRKHDKDGHRHHHEKKSAKRIDDAVMAPNRVSEGANRGYKEMLLRLTTLMRDVPHGQAMLQRMITAAVRVFEEGNIFKLGIKLWL